MQSLISNRRYDQVRKPYAEASVESRRADIERTQVHSMLVENHAQIYAVLYAKLELFWNGDIFPHQKIAFSEELWSSILVWICK